MVQYCLHQNVNVAIDIKATCYINFNNLNNCYISISIFLNVSKNEFSTNQILIKENLNKRIKLIFSRKIWTFTFLIEFSIFYIEKIFQIKFSLKKLIIFLVLDQLSTYKFLSNYGIFEMDLFQRLNLLSIGFYFIVKFYFIHWLLFLWTFYIRSILLVNQYNNFYWKDLIHILNL
jgi:hypothetical protein